MVDHCIKRIQQWLFPSLCLLCARPSPAGTRLCPACTEDLPHNESACRHCALPLPVHLEAPWLCGQCLRSGSDLPPIRAACRYEAPASYLVQRLKFAGRLAYAPAIADLMRAALRRCDGAAPQLIVPVPLHRRRLRERGFNQALEIARPLASSLSIPLDGESCIRTRDTGRQSGLSAKERRGNVRGAFALRRPVDARRVAVVDDVVTTGNTVRELARTLRTAGVREVEVWTFARAAAER